MRFFANPSTERVRDAMRAGLIDCIETPKQGNKPVRGATFCMDNGAFGKGYPGDEAWFAWLQANSYRASDCAFVVAPDVVGDARATYRRSMPWLPKIRALGYRAAYVAQDGQEYLPVPWRDFDVLFIGGTTDWKLGHHARELVAEAKTHGKCVHMGRVNSFRRLRYAQAIGCDSADGTYIAFGPNQNLPNVLTWLDAINGQSYL
jgi:hypothetical protein